MARNTSVSLTKGIIAAVAMYGCTLAMMQYFVGPMFMPATPEMGERHPATTASHMKVKKVTTHLFLLKTARTRKKKRRAVLQTARGNSTFTAFSNGLQWRSGAAGELVRKLGGR